MHELGDRRAEALTRNNLALALVQTGGVALAVQQFEEALILLRDLGDEEHEGQVIANLALSAAARAATRTPTASSPQHSTSFRLSRPRTAGSKSSSAGQADAARRFGGSLARLYWPRR